MRTAHLLTAGLLFLASCERRSPPRGESPEPKRSESGRLGDLSSSLAAVRAEFNAHSGEARFLTLLSPS